MKAAVHLFLFLGLASLLSCSNARVSKVEGNPDFKLSDYKTFAFYKLENSGDQPRTALYRSQVEALKTAIARQLEAKGLRQADDQPGLLINIGIAIAEKVQTRPTNIITDPPAYIGQRRYTWRSQEVEVGRYRQGTVDVHLIDRQQNAMVWRGVVEDVLPNKAAKWQKTIEDSIKKLFERVPA